MILAATIWLVGVAGCLSVVSPAPMSEPEVDAGSADAGAADADSGVCLRHPPERPDGAVTSSDELVLAITRFSLGDTAPSGEPDTHAWRHIGYDLDGIGDGEKHAAHCQPLTTECGIDNNFGAAFAGGLMTSDDTNDRIANGSLPALVFRLRGLSLDAPASTAEASVVLAEPIDGPPVWDGNDPFGAYTESLNDGDLEQPLVKIASSYTNEGVWVAGPMATLSVPLSISPEYDLGEGRSFLLPLRKAVVTVKLSTSGATEGTIAGVVSAKDFLNAAVVNQIGRTEPEVCGQAGIYESILGQTDIDSTGGGECDAFSVGFAFEARTVRLVDVLPPQPPIVPCEGWY